MTAHQLPVLLRSFVAARWRGQRLHGPALARYQERRAQQIVAYAQEHSPFYRHHWAGHDLHDWRALPTVDKALMMEHFTDFNTRNISRELALEVALRAEESRNFQPLVQGLTVGLSSGTSGHRGLFLLSPEEQAAWAGTILARMLHRLRPRRLRVAFFLRSNSNLYEQVGGHLLQFRYIDLMQPLENTVDELNRWSPDIIVAPPTLLGLLATSATQGVLRIAPERLISVAEVLEGQEREWLQRVFAVPIEQIYQCTEGLLAASCERGALHMQEDLVLLQCEPLGDGRVTPIVTDLRRKTQPIIRYRLNDLLVLQDEPCACGSSFRVIERIEGRCDDICYFPTATGELRPFFADVIRRIILLASPHILDYQATQEKPGELHISLKTEKDHDFTEIMRAVEASVDETMKRYGCNIVRLSIEEGLPTYLSGTKRRRVQRISPA